MTCSLKQLHNRYIFVYLFCIQPHLCLLLMAYIIFHKLWRSEFYDNVSAKESVQDKNLNHSKLKVIDSYKNRFKKTTKFEAFNDEVVKNKACLDLKL